MHQYFSVGEEVIVCTKHHGEINGEDVIVKYMGLGSIRDRKSGKVVYGPMYMISKFDFPVAQRALRKKHKPSDQSFSELINSTKEVKA